MFIHGLYTRSIHFISRRKPFAGRLCSQEDGSTSFTLLTRKKKEKEKKKRKEKRSMLPEIKRARLASTFLPSVQLVRLSEIRVVWTDGEGQDRCRLCLHSQKKKKDSANAKIKSAPNAKHQ